MKRQVIVIERNQHNLEETARLCMELANSNVSYQTLLPDEFLNKMELMEKEGMRFLNVKKNDKKTKMIAPIVITIVFCLIMLGVMGTIIMASLTEKAPIVMVIFWVLLSIGAIVGIVMALRQRVKEIEGGEEDAASKY